MVRRSPRAGDAAYAVGTAAIVAGALRRFGNEFLAGISAGRCTKRRDLPLPKIVDFDETSRRFVYDTRQDRKRPDWTFEPSGCRRVVRGGRVKVGALAVSPAVSIAPGRSLREAARLMVEHGIGSTVILDGEALVGILTERDLMRAMAANADLDGATVADAMTRDVVTVGSDWEVYEATAEMAGHHIRHVVVCDQGHVQEVLSVRDVLLAGQRVGLTGDRWAVLRDPITFTIRERRRLRAPAADAPGIRAQRVRVGRRPRPPGRQLVVRHPAARGRRRAAGDARAGP